VDGLSGAVRGVATGAAEVHGAASRARLEAMGIDLWLLRRNQDAQPVAAESSASGPTRIRLESGTGEWLIVADEAERAAYRVLLDDLRAVLGPAACRFGKWSDTPEAGIGPDDWQDHGIGQVLVFGDVPAKAGELLRAEALSVLAESAKARRALWALLRPRLVG